LLSSCSSSFTGSGSRIKEQWLPAHVTRKQAVAIVLDQFKRTVTQTLEITEVRAKR
jgi:hypothetical protein